MSFNEKSPVSMLKELCDRERGILTHEFLPYELNASTFICVVNAFDMSAKGEGRTKKLAKHKACENLLSKYCGLISLFKKKNIVQLKSFCKRRFKITKLNCTFQLNCLK